MWQKEGRIFMWQVQYVHRSWAEVKNKEGYGSSRWSGKPAGGQILEDLWGHVKYIFENLSLEQWMPMNRRVKWQICTLTKKIFYLEKRIDKNLCLFFFIFSFFFIVFLKKLCIVNLQWFRYTAKWFSLYVILTGRKMTSGSLAWGNG